MMPHSRAELIRLVMGTPISRNSPVMTAQAAGVSLSIQFSLQKPWLET